MGLVICKRYFPRPGQLYSRAVLGLSRKGLARVGNIIGTVVIGTKGTNVCFICPWLFQYHEQGRFYCVVYWQSWLSIWWYELVFCLERSVSYFIKSFTLKLCFSSLLYHFAMLICCLIGFFYRSYFYSVLLMDLVHREETLYNVIRSVTRNGRSIVLTGKYKFQLGLRF